MPSPGDLPSTLDQATRTWADVPALRVTVITSPANGDAPVLVLVPPGFDPARPATIHTHFHGDMTSVAAPRGPHTLAIREHLAKDPQRLWVLPEARRNVGSHRTNWNNVKDHAATVRDALAAVGLSPVSGSRSVVSAHSSGGRALAAAMTSGTLQADQLVLLDCLYEHVGGAGANTAILNAVKAGALAHVKDVIIVATGSYPAERDAQLLAAAGGKARLEPLVPAEGVSDHEAAARHHLVPRSG